MKKYLISFIFAFSALMMLSGCIVSEQKLTDKIQSALAYFILFPLMLGCQCYEHIVRGGSAQAVFCLLPKEWELQQFWEIGAYERRA